MKFSFLCANVFVLSVTLHWLFYFEYCIHRVSIKNSQNCFYHIFVKFPPTLISFSRDMAKTIELCKVHSLPPHLIYVNALQLCETQMLQIVTLGGDYLYRIAHHCIISLTVNAMRFNNFVVYFKYLMVKIANSKIAH